MSPEHIALVRNAWRRLVPLEEHVAELFYRILFELDPSLRRLFRGDIVEQGRKLMAMLDMIVSQLDRLGEIVPLVEQLGRRHARYGVEDAHFDIVGVALLSTLRGGLGDAWTRETEEAWTIAYTTLAGVMRDASAHVDSRR
jgi:hemoglobin-like flavoprotein